MKKKGSNFYKIILIAVIFTIVGLVIWYGSGIREVSTYNINIPAPQKIEKISKWIPKDAEFFLAIDVPKVASDEPLRKRLEQLAATKEGVVPVLISSLLSKDNIAGMIMLVGRMGPEGATPKMAWVGQGAFSEKKVVPAIRAMLAAGKAGLVSEKVGDSIMYYESDARYPFAFMVLDGEHVAAGERDSLKELFSEKGSEKIQAASIPDTSVFGRVKFGERLSKVFPEGVMKIDSMEVMAKDAHIIMGRVPAKDAADAANLKMFLEGARSLVMLEQDSNPALVEFFKGIDIADDGNSVMVSCDIFPLLDMWMVSDKK